MELQELQRDAEETKTLLAAATRKRVQDVLAIELSKIETKLKELKCSSESNKSAATPSSTNTTSSRAYTIVIRNYSWDQSDKFLKLYLTLKDVQNLDKENIVCNFGTQSLSFRASELEGKNHELTIANLAYSIVPDKSYFKVKNDMVVVFAAKSKSTKWEAVTYEERRIIETKKASKPETGGNKEDPSSGLMGIMKQMYDDGDDEMKRMLNKTWYESQQKKQAGLESELDMGSDMAMNMGMNMGF